MRLKAGRATTAKEAFGQAGKSFECQWLLLAYFVRMGLEAARFPTPFQAEYEGSIPSTRSNVFKALSQPPVFILTNPAVSF
jgi:hypothetical protein